LQSGPGALLHHENFWDVVSSKVYVYRDDIHRLEAGRIRLEGGQEIQCEAIFCGTGWRPSLDFFDEELRVELGLPHDLQAESVETTQKWLRLAENAKETVVKMFPMLATPPAHHQSHARTTPYRLYQGIAPLNDNSILFMNHISTGNKLFIAEVQGMWAVAYFDNQLQLPSKEDMEQSIALLVAFSQMRYLSAGGLGNNIAMHSILYADTLLKEMGLSAHLQSKSWWKKSFEPFWPADLGRVWDEYRSRV
jgi:hypothetical protein